MRCSPQETKVRGETYASGWKRIMISWSGGGGEEKKKKRRIKRRRWVEGEEEEGIARSK